jgi:hypothetical protein
LIFLGVSLSLLQLYLLVVGAPYLGIEFFGSVACSALA